MTLGRLGRPRGRPMLVIPPEGAPDFGASSRREVEIYGSPSDLPESAPFHAAIAEDADAPRVDAFRPDYLLDVEEGRCRSGMRETSILVAGVRGPDGVTPVGCLAADRRLARLRDDAVPDGLDEIVAYGFDVLAVYVFRRHRGRGYGAALAEAAVRIAEADLRRIRDDAAVPTGLRATVSAEAVTAAGARICRQIAGRVEASLDRIHAAPAPHAAAGVVRTEFVREIRGRGAAA